MVDQEIRVVKETETLTNHSSLNLNIRVLAFSFPKDEERNNESSPRRRER